MIALQSIVEVLGSPMLGDGQNQTQRWRGAPRLVRDDPRGGDASRVDGPVEEDLRGCSIAALAAIGIHDLAVILDGSVDIHSKPPLTDVSLGHPPTPPH